MRPPRSGRCRCVSTSHGRLVLLPLGYESASVVSAIELGLSTMRSGIGVAEQRFFRQTAVEVTLSEECEHEGYPDFCARYCGLLLPLAEATCHCHAVCLPLHGDYW